MALDQLPLLDVPPMPASAREAQRVDHTRTRRRVLYSQHEPDVQSRIFKAVGTTRANAWRIVDMTSNPAWYVCSQLAALYRDIPEVTPPEGGEDVAAAIAEAGYWQLAQRVQRDTIGLNDLLVRVDVDPEDKTPAFRLAFPDLCSIEASPFKPTQPTAVKEWIRHPADPGRWVQLITRPAERIYAALDHEGRDISTEVLGDTYTGPDYPFVVGGKPVLPYVAYHATESGTCLDPYSGREIFEGSLQLGVYYSFFGHILRSSAWGQRWALGARPAQADLDEAGRRAETITDPATLLILEGMEDAQPGSTTQVGQFAPAVDPERILAAVERYERRVVEMALSTVGVSRRESDVRSAASLAVSREAQRDAQKAYEPVFRRSDTRLLQLVSGLMGGPTADWRITYKSIPQDPQVTAAQTAQMQALVDAGLLDKVTAYMELHPGMRKEEAEAKLTEIAAINAKFNSPAANGTPVVPAQSAG